MAARIIHATHVQLLLYTFALFALVPSLVCYTDHFLSANVLFVNTLAHCSICPRTYPAFADRARPAPTPNPTHASATESPVASFITCASTHGILLARTIEIGIASIRLCTIHFLLFSRTPLNRRRPRQLTRWTREHKSLRTTVAPSGGRHIFNSSVCDSRFGRPRPVGARALGGKDLEPVVFRWISSGGGAFSPPERDYRGPQGREWRGRCLFLSERRKGDGRVVSWRGRAARGFNGACVRGAPALLLSYFPRRNSRGKREDMRGARGRAWTQRAGRFTVRCRPIVRVSYISRTSVCTG